MVLSGQRAVTVAGDDRPPAVVRARQNDRRGGHPYRRKPVLAAGAGPALPAGMGDGNERPVVAEDAADRRARAADADGSGRNGVQFRRDDRSEEHTSELESLMRNSYDGFSMKKKHRQ